MEGGARLGQMTYITMFDLWHVCVYGMETVPRKAVTPVLRR